MPPAKLYPGSHPDSNLHEAPTQSERRPTSPTLADDPRACTIYILLTIGFRSFEWIYKTS